MSRRILLSLALLAVVGCKKGSKEVTAPPPAPSVSSVTVAPQTLTFASLGETQSLAAEVRLSNGSVGTQSVTWSSSNTAVATVAGGTVTAVGNGSATITAAVGTVNGSATATVSQVVSSVTLLPSDTVMKGPGALRGRALDARGNTVTGGNVQWESLTPAITTVNEAGVLTPRSTGVARVKFTVGSKSATAIVRTVWNVTKLSDLFPLFEYNAAAGQRRLMSDVNQVHADLRATILTTAWNYFSGVLPSNGNATTDFYFTTWPQIFVEFLPFCGGAYFPNQTAWTICTAPNRQHFMIPEGTANDFENITRALALQAMQASHFDSRNFPWFSEGWGQWLAGGSIQGNTIVAANPRAVAIADFKSGDSQQLLAPLDTLVRIPFARYYENLPQRTPVAVRMAQSVLFVSFLNRDYPTVIPAILARIRSTPGAGFTNDQLLAEITTRTGRTLAQLETEYLAYARSL